MKKRVVVVLCLSLLLITLTACGNKNWKHGETTDPANYDDIVSSVGLAEFFPDTISDCNVKSFSYYSYSFLNHSHSVFLEITAEQEEFDRILDRARQCPHHEETDAYGAEGYKEIVYTDYCQGSEAAEIQKVIYNTDTRTMVFVDLCAKYEDDFDSFDYFDWLGMDRTEYEDRYTRLYGY